MSAPLPAGAAGPTPGPYRRVGRTVVAYMDPSKNGGLNFDTRWAAFVQIGDMQCSEAEATAVAQLFKAAPDLLAALQGMVDAFPEATNWGQEGADKQREAIAQARVALSVSRPTPTEGGRA